MKKRLPSHESGTAGCRALFCPAVFALTSLVTSVSAGEPMPARSPPLAVTQLAHKSPSRSATRRSAEPFLSPTTAGPAKAPLPLMQLTVTAPPRIGPDPPEAWIGLGWGIVHALAGTAVGALAINARDASFLSYVKARPALEVEDHLQRAQIFGLVSAGLFVTAGMTITAGSLKLYRHHQSARQGWAVTANGLRVQF